MQEKLIGAYATSTGTGWAAYDKHGFTRPISSDEAAELESDRNGRNASAGKLPSPRHD